MTGVSRRSFLKITSAAAGAAAAGIAPVASGPIVGTSPAGPQNVVQMLPPSLDLSELQRLRDKLEAAIVEAFNLHMGRSDIVQTRLEIGHAVQVAMYRTLGECEAVQEVYESQFKLTDTDKFMGMQADDFGVEVELKLAPATPKFKFSGRLRVSDELSLNEVIGD